MNSSLLRMVVALLAALPVSAQTATEGFVDAIDVRVVNVEAVVTDRGDNRVRGLAAEDFQLLVDGREVPIEFFTEIVDGTVVSSTGGSPEGEAAPAVAGPVERSVLVFVDDQFSIAPQRDRVLKEVEESLGELSPRDRVAVVAFDGRRLELLTGWTADRRQIAASLAKARERPAYGLHITEDFGFPLSGVASAAASAMRSLPLPEGRKVMLLLSGGWPLPQRESFGTLLEPVPAAVVSSLDEGFYRPIVEAANLLGYTLYPVDVPGLEASAGVDVTVDSPGTMPRMISSEAELASHYTLDLLALETGGRSSLNSNRLEALERMAEDTASYYWLGFTPEWRADDRRHEIELKVRRPGLRVRNRGSFSDLSKATETAMAAEGLLRFGEDLGPSRAAKRIGVELGEARRVGLSAVELPVTLTIPADALTAVPAAEGYSMEAVLSFGALNRWAARSKLTQVPMRFTAERAPRPGEVVRFQTVLKLRRGPQNVIFTVRDNLSGDMLWASLGYEP